jgi:hypothetical protein
VKVGMLKLSTPTRSCINLPNFSAQMLVCHLRNLVCECLWRLPALSWRQIQYQRLSLRIFGCCPTVSTRLAHRVRETQERGRERWNILRLLFEHGYLLPRPLPPPTLCFVGYMYSKELLRHNHSSQSWINPRVIPVYL